jgi:hypothetical protein
MRSTKDSKIQSFVGSGILATITKEGLIEKIVFLEKPASSII